MFVPLPFIKKLFKVLKLCSELEKHLFEYIFFGNRAIFLLHINELYFHSLGVKYSDRT